MYQVQIQYIKIISFLYINDEHWKWI
jgi:hypothetical protein